MGGRPAPGTAGPGSGDADDGAGSPEALAASPPWSKSPSRGEAAAKPAGARQRTASAAPPGPSTAPDPGAATWTPDERVPEHPLFPRALVQEALIGEASAPGERVFEGTSHRNVVVPVSSLGRSVVVRRVTGGTARLERSFLSEHAVLTAIERSAVRVRAPRVLALGTDRHAEPFAVHSYEGPRDGLEAPPHPVNGLKPQEADDLVAQLAALTRVDHRALDPVAGGVDFYPWLCDELVRLVGNLSRPAGRLARELGLPSRERLREILSGHHVTHRGPVLLHGDLNPWNLVRGDGGTLTLIDWEMAMIGDPLYDLVRHLHLTPTRPEIRRRMFDAWQRLLPERHTRGWERDRQLYRWIEIVRSAYVDLDRLTSGANLDAPNVRRAVDSYAMTLKAATDSLGLPQRRTGNPRLARALPQGAIDRG